MQKKKIVATCGICGGKRASVVRRKLRFDIKRDVLRCVNCGFVYLRRSRAGMKFYAGKEYRKLHGPTLGKKNFPRDIFDTYLPYQHLIHESMGGLLKPGAKILDVGCSTGHFLYSLKNKVKTRVGVELSRADAAFIRKNLDFPVYDKPIETLRLKEGPFDVITALQVLEHVEDPVDFLRSLGKHLKPGGHLYLELPNIDDVLLTEYRAKGYEDFYYREPHLSYFSRATLKRALSKAGFEGMIRTVQRYTLMNHVHWITAQVPQSNFNLGMSPELVPRATTPAAKALNVFMKRADKEYRELVGKLGLGESLVFVGKKKA